MKIAIIGAGYVGLVTGISLAKLGHQIVCIDKVVDKVSQINLGISPFYEPSIDKYLKEVVRKKLLYGATNLENIPDYQIIIITVGTPTIENKIDLTQIEEASKLAGQSLKNSKKYQVVVVKSTVLPGVTDNIVKPILESASGKKIGEFGLCMNPEFLREGSAMGDALNPDRIVIGQFDEKSGESYAKIFNGIAVPIIFTNLKTAEMIKYTANSLFATLISFSNEIARISENIESVDVVDIWNAVHLDRRLTVKNSKAHLKPGVLSYLSSGCGFGGSCFPKDTQALLDFAQNLGEDPILLKSVININKGQPLRVITMLKKVLGEIENKKIAVLGLAFKPQTSDLRQSPALPIIQNLRSLGAKVVCHDPQAYKGISSELLNLTGIFMENIEQALEGADAAIIVTSWDEYQKLDPSTFKKLMRQPIVIDTRRIYNKQLFQSSGINYLGVGLKLEV